MRCSIEAADRVCDPWSMPGVESVQEVRRSVRRDLKAASRTGTPPLGHLSGMHRVPTEGGVFAVAFDAMRPAMAGGPGICEIATLADLALGGAIRTRLGAAVPMPTVSMTLQLVPGSASRVSWAEADCPARPVRTTPSRARLLAASGEVVGDALGVFSLPPLPYDGSAAAMPWESWARPGPDLDGSEHEDLRPEEAEILDGLAAHALGSPRRAWGTAHVGQRTASHEGLFSMTPSSVMTNRAGHVQGGALLGTAVLMAASRGDFPAESLVTATIDFLGATTVDAPVCARPEVLHATRGSLFCSVTLEQVHRPRCQVSAVFRR